MLLIFETHPVQYRVPLYQCLHKRVGDRFEVIYAANSFLKENHDKEFGQKVVWDVPMLEGYPNRVLGNHAAVTRNRWADMHGRGIYAILREGRPKQVLLTGFNRRFDCAALLYATLLRIPVWIRVETQDRASVRPMFKNFVRYGLYRALYSTLTGALFLGKLNREHLLAHGFKPRQLVPSPYSVPDFCSALSVKEKLKTRTEVRSQLGIPDNSPVILFSGKLIPKKQPDLLLDAFIMLLKCRPDAHLIFIGSGELEHHLKERAGSYPIHFCGFINQKSLPGYYLAADTLCLPSRLEGETWGLVVNEALQAGCSVAVSDAVGSSVEFGDWERAHVFPHQSTEACYLALMASLQHPRDFSWCTNKMQTYSIEATAQGFVHAFFSDT